MKEYDELTPALIAFVQAQHLFFIGSAPTDPEGLVNISPKGTLLSLSLPLLSSFLFPPSLFSLFCSFFEQASQEALGFAVLRVHGWPLAMTLQGRPAAWASSATLTWEDQVSRRWRIWRTTAA